MVNYVYTKPPPPLRMPKGERGEGRKIARKKWERREEERNGGRGRGGGGGGNTCTSKGNEGEFTTDLIKN